MKPYNPMVSVVMSCFNGDKYLSEALQSIINQTYTNWELIFWDNQSTDLSANIFKNFKDPRFKYFYAEKHTQVSEARTEAIKHINGEIISFLDVDDWWAKNKLQKQIELFENPEIGLVYGNYYLFNEKTNQKKICHSKPLPRGRILEDLLKSYVVGLLTISIRKSFYLQLSYKFHKDLVIMGDMDLVIRLSAICKFDVVQKPIATYRYHDNNFSIINRETHLKEIEIWYEIMKNYKKIYFAKNFHMIVELYSKMKIIHFIVTNRRFLAFKYFMTNKLNLNDRVKLLLALFLPTFIVNILRNK